MCEKAKLKNEDYLQLIKNIPAGFALHEIICNEEGEPVDYRFLEVNPAFEKLTGLKAKDILGRTCLEVLPKTEPSWIERYGKVALTGESVSFEDYAIEIDRHFEVTAFRTGPNQFACTFNDITERKQTEEELRKIEWMLSKKKSAPPKVNKKEFVPKYGELTDLNTARLILDSVGADVLKDIADDYLSLLDTSSAVYEKNGDYALGIFSSGWCRFMDQASRKLCNTDDNVEALNSEKWLCHESCWKDASLTAINTGNCADIECSGGIRLHAQPIRAGENIIGAINFGYGDPPQDKQKLLELAQKYNVSIDELTKKAKEYETKPPYIIELAKNRLKTTSKLIGEIVSRKMTEEAISKTNTALIKAKEKAEEGLFCPFPEKRHRDLNLEI